MLRLIQLPWGETRLLILRLHPEQCFLFYCLWFRNWGPLFTSHSGPVFFTSVTQQQDAAPQLVCVPKRMMASARPAAWTLPKCGREVKPRELTLWWCCTYWRVHDSNIKDRAFATAPEPLPWHSQSYYKVSGIMSFYQISIIRWNELSKVAQRGIIKTETQMSLVPRT
jgi:hypothetical protein